MHELGSSALCKDFYLSFAAIRSFVEWTNRLCARKVSRSFGHCHVYVRVFDGLLLEYDWGGCLSNETGDSRKFESVFASAAVSVLRE
jgi:hypothetical protein